MHWPDGVWSDATLDMSTVWKVALFLIHCVPFQVLMQGKEAEQDERLEDPQGWHEGISQGCNEEHIITRWRSTSSMSRDKRWNDEGKNKNNTFKVKDISLACEDEGFEGWKLQHIIGQNSLAWWWMQRQGPKEDIATLQVSSSYKAADGISIIYYKARVGVIYIKGGHKKTPSLEWRTSTAWRR